MMKFILITLLFCASGSMASQVPTHYTQQEIDRLSDFATALQSRQQTIVDAETSVDIGRMCITHFDCLPHWRCINMVDALYDLVNTTSHSSEIPRLQRKARIYGKECVRPVEDVVDRYPMEKITTRFKELVEETNEILGSGESGVWKFGLDVNDMITKKFDVSSMKEPMQRVGTITQHDPNSMLYLLFALRGKSGNPTIDDTLTLLLALSSTQNPGASVDTNLFANPFLLYTLLGKGNSDTSSKVLLYSLLLSPNGGIGANALDPANAFSNPLILLSLLEKNNNNINLNDLLPLIFAQGQQDPFGSATGAGAGLGSLLPILLLSNSSLGNNNLLPLLLLSGGLPGNPNSGGQWNPNSGGQWNPISGAPGTLGGIESILPLLLSSGSSSGGSNSIKDLLPLLLYSGGMDPNSMNLLLPLLLLSNSSSGSNNNLLTLLALSGGMNGMNGMLGGGNFASILPLLLLNNSSLGKSNDLLGLFLLLQSGMGQRAVLPDGSPNPNPVMAYDPSDPSNIQQMLPLLLLLNSGSDNVVLILYIFGFLTAVPESFVVG